MPKLSLLFLILFCTFSLTNSFGQTQEEIEQMLNGGNSDVQTSPEKFKKEKTVKEKKIKQSKAKDKAISADEVKSKKDKLNSPKEAEESKIKPEKTPKEAKSKKGETQELVEKTEKGKEKNTIKKNKDKAYAGRPKMLLKKGDKFLNSGKLYGANKYYTAALDKTKKKKLQGVLNYKLGRSSFEIRDYLAAESYFEQALGLPMKKKKFNDGKYYLGLAYKHQARYAEAKDVLNDFIADAQGNDKLEFQSTKSRLEIKGCDFALNLVVDEPQYTIKNPGENVNGPFADFGPEIRRNELIYSKIISDVVSDKDEMHHVAHLFSAEMYHEKYNYAQDFSPILNEGEAYVCNPSFSAGGKTVYFTKCKVLAQTKNSCIIYSSDLVGGVWSDPIALNDNINYEESSNTHPQIVELDDGQELLYFTSDRVAGKGGKDIWYAVKNENGDFGRAENLGSPINTRYDEVSPFYHAATNTLYFSSDGKPSLGGLDVFKSEYVDEEWTTPLNMETPVNSSLDDYDFVLNPNASLGFLVSNREGTTTVKTSTCCDDIFELRTTQIDLLLRSLVYAESSSGRELVKEAELVLKNLSSSISESLKFDGNSFSHPLEKESDYELSASNKNYEEVSIQFTTKGMLKSDTLQYDLFFKERKTFENDTIGIVYYEYNQSNLTKEAPETLEAVLAFLKKHPNTLVQVGAHTDSNGPADYNLSLSEGRCKAASNYLTFNGIAKERIVEKWFGESKPVAPEFNEDGSDNVEGRALNRRTEFIIVGE